METERLILRWFTADDLELLVDLDSDPEVKHFIDNGAPVDRAELAEQLDRLTIYDREAGFGRWVAHEKTSGDFLGWFHFRASDEHGPLEPQLGYRLRRAAWGKGFATEGSIALIDRGFRELGVERVYAETMAVNTRSRRVMEKVGLRLVREFKLDWPVYIEGNEHGDVEYAITRAEWLAANAD